MNYEILNNSTKIEKTYLFHKSKNNLIIVPKLRKHISSTKAKTVVAKFKSKNSSSNIKCSSSTTNIFSMIQSQQIQSQHINRNTTSARTKLVATQQTSSATTNPVEAAQLQNTNNNKSPKHY